VFEDVCLMPIRRIRIWIGIDMKILTRIRIGIKTMPIHNTVTTYLIFSFCARNLAFGRKFYDVVGLLATNGDKSGDGEEAGFRFTPGAAAAPQLPSLPTTRPSSPVAGPSGIQVRQ
jgi:hypothetical protein